MKPVPFYSALTGAIFAAACLAARLSAQPATAADPKPDDTVKLNVFTVSAEQDVGYRATNSTSGTRTNETLKHVPLNIQILTADFMRDINADDIFAAIAYTADAVPDANPLQNNNTMIRGFSSNFQLRNFFRWFGISDSFNIERVEVMRGPAAVLYSQAFPGGALNVISKTPRSKDQTTVSVRAASFGDFRTTLDYNENLGFAGVRLNGVYQEKRSYNDFEGQRVKGFAPSVRIEPSKNTTITADFEQVAYQRDFQGILPRWQAAIPAARIGASDIFRDAPLTARYFGPDAYFNQTAIDARGVIEQRVSDRLAFTLAYNYLWNDRSNFQPSTGAVANMFRDARGDYVQHRWVKNTSANSNGGLQASGLYKFEIAGSEHKLLFGVDLGREHFQSGTFLEFNPGTNVARTYAIYINEPGADYSHRPGAELRHTNGDNSVARTSGYYVTLQSAFADGKLRSLLGARYDRFENEYLPGSPNFGGINAEVSGDHVSPMAGLMYAPTSAYTLYTLVSGAFTPNTSRRDAYNNILPPTQALGYEVGVKTSAWDGRLSGTLSLFQTDQKNRTEIDTNPPPDATNVGSPSISSGKDRARGVDLDLLYTPRAGWDVIMSYSYTDSRVISSVVPASVGNRIPNHAYNQLGGFTRYTFSDGPLKGFFIGGGLRYRDRNLWRYVNGIAQENDALFVVNGLVGYTWNMKKGRQVRAAFNVDNIFDRDAIIGGASPINSAPRSYAFSLSSSF